MKLETYEGQFRKDIHSLDVLKIMETVRKEVIILSDPVRRASCTTRTLDRIPFMIAALLAAAKKDPGRFATIYQIIRIVESTLFWDDISDAYDFRITGARDPFEDEYALMKHALAFEQIYHKHGFHNMEALLLDEDSAE